MDDDDRRAVGEGLVRLLSYAVVILVAAITVGLAFRLFQIVSGV